MERSPRIGVKAQTSPWPLSESVTVHSLLAQACPASLLFITHLTGVLPWHPITKTYTHSSTLGTPMSLMHTLGFGGTYSPE